MQHDAFIVDGTKPKCLGTGLVALDVVIGANPRTPPAFWAGGSCGNILTILSYLGWETYPIARLSRDSAAEELVRDMERWGVDTSLISRDAGGSTPIIVERIRTNASGRPVHRFEWVCPNCGSWLPRYRPVLAKDVEAISCSMPPGQVFFFDRAVRSAIELAREQKRRGAMIVFEPSSMKDQKLFRECVAVADIVKYSCERLADDLDLRHTTRVPLEVRTLGDVGLRYRIDGGRWTQIPGYPVENFRDAAGSGDWCTAGLVHTLGLSGRKALESLNNESVVDALRFGQALAALNCQFEGARGGMYSLNKDQFLKSVLEILDENRVPEAGRLADDQAVVSAFQCICPECSHHNPSTSQ